MKKLLAFIFGLVLFVSCDKKGCNEAIPYCNEAIPYYYSPVCGCNDISYPNWETAECHGITNYREGECEGN